MSEQNLAVVTGAARGIGRATVIQLLQQGRIVAGLDINQELLDELQVVVKNAGYSVITKCLDITDTAQLGQAIDQLAQEHGGIAILVNNAGITRDGLMMQMSEQDLDKVMNVNFRAAYFAAKFALRSMIKNRFGRIISLSSVAAVMGNAGQSNYAASKAALIGMSKSLAREVAKKNITVNCVAPGFIITDMTDVLPEPVKDAAKQMIPARKFGTVEDVAKAIAFLAHDDSGYITGQVLCVDGGMAM
ncbi:MAG: 3-oxoacyl-ACP reductase FabG [Planctomycetota bacterium]